jgi:hypothetical protein
VAQCLSIADFNDLYVHRCLELLASKDAIDTSGYWHTMLTCESSHSRHSSITTETAPRGSAPRENEQPMRPAVGSALGLKRKRSVCCLFEANRLKTPLSNSDCESIFKGSIRLPAQRGNAQSPYIAAFEWPTVACPLGLASNFCGIRLAFGITLKHI